jgi:hypothetical protein
MGFHYYLNKNKYLMFLSLLRSTCHLQESKHIEMDEFEKPSIYWSYCAINVSVCFGGYSAAA